MGVAHHSPKGCEKRDTPAQGRWFRRLLEEGAADRYVNVTVLCQMKERWAVLDPLEAASHNEKEGRSLGDVKGECPDFSGRDGFFDGVDLLEHVLVVVVGLLAILIDPLAESDDLRHHFVARCLYLARDLRRPTFTSVTTWSIFPDSSRRNSSIFPVSSCRNSSTFPRAVWSRYGDPYSSRRPSHRPHCEHCV